MAHRRLCQAGKVGAANQFCFILLTTDLRLQSTAPVLIVTSWAPFRVCLKANIGLLIGYFNALNYGEEEEKGGKKNHWHIHLCKSFRVWKNLIQKQKPFESLPFPAPPCLAPPPLPSFTSPSSCWAVTVPTYQILLAASFPDTFLWMWPGSSSLQLLNCYVCHMLRRRRRRSWSIMTTGIRDSRQSQNAFSGEREAIYFNS